MDEAILRRPRVKPGTVPFAWRKRLGYDGPQLAALTRLFVKTVLPFYGWIHVCPSLLGAARNHPTARA
jgi:hypothetical protein